MGLILPKKLLLLTSASVAPFVPSLFGLFDWSVENLSFSRGSIKREYDKTLLQTIFDEDVPAFAYDPVTGEYRGLSYEPQETNIFIQSNNYTWTTTTTTFIANSATNVDGLNTAGVISALATTSTHGGITQQPRPTVVTGTTYTAKVNIKKRGYRYAGVGLSYTFGYKDFRYDFDTDAVVSSTFDSYTVRKVSEEFIEVTVTQEAVHDGAYQFMSFSFSPYEDPSATFLGETDKGLIVSNIMCVEGSTIGTHIETNGSLVTRAADQLTFDIPAGMTTLTITHDDDSTTVLPVVGGTSGYILDPADLNRPYIAHGGIAVS